MSEKFYDHTQWIAEQRQARPQWEAMPDMGNPIVQVTKQALQPLETAQSEVIAMGEQGRQDDNAESIARGVLIQALPVIGLSLPLAGLIMALVWMTGIVSVGFLGNAVGVFGLWSLFSLFCYNQIAKRSQKHSYYGVEHHKIDALTGIRHQELSNDYHLKRAALDAYIRQLESKNRE